MQMNLLAAGILLALSTQRVQIPESWYNDELPAWLEGILERPDVFYMSPDIDGSANDGLTTSTSWPYAMRYPRKVHGSADYGGYNGTRSYPDGVGVIVMLPGDYSMRKMHGVRVEEYWPHWDSAPTAGMEPDAENPLIIVYASAYNSYEGMTLHPTQRLGSQADVATLRFDTMTHFVYVHGLNSEATYSGIDFAGSTDGKVYRCQISTGDAAAISRRFNAARNEAAYNFAQRRYPWSLYNDYAGLYLKDGPNDDCWDHHNVILDYADSMQGACRSYLYRQDPLGINITAPGAGYTVGDALIFGTGTAGAVYRAAVGTVTAVDGGGGITAVTCTDMGAYDGGGFPSVTITGTGTGATFTCTSLAGPYIVFGHDLVAPNIWEQGWPENTGYGGLKGYLCEDNWFGCTDISRVSNVYNTIGGVENCVDLKTGGTLESPAVFRRNIMFGLRANLTTPSAVFTFHDVTEHVEIYENIIVDCSSLINLNTQYHGDRYSNDGGSTGGTAYPAWESFLTVNFHDNIISDIHDFATTGSYSAMQGRVFYSGNSITFQNNELAFCDYLAEAAVNAAAEELVLGGNLLHEPVDLDAWDTDWTDGTISSGYVEESTIYTIPWTEHTITVRRMVPA